MGRKRKQEQTNQAVKMDGVENVLTGLGRIGRDASTATAFKMDAFLTESELNASYYGNGIARRIVDMIPNEALKKGLECDEELYDELERLDAYKHLTELGKDARLFGGAVMLMLARDGVAELSEPLRTGNIQRVERLQVFDRHQLLVTADDYDHDIYSPTFGEVITYNLRKKNDIYVKVHASRVIRLDGDRLPSTPFTDNGYWHASVLQGCFDSLKSYLTAQGFSDIIIKEWSLTILKVRDLRDSYANGREYLIAKRLNDANMSKSIANMILMDAEDEDFSRVFSNVAGYSDLMLRTMELVSANSGVPMTKLFGRSPEGMNATGEGDFVQWAGAVETYQMQTLQSAINRLIEVLALQKEWVDKPEEISWNYPALKPLDELQTAEVRLKNAQADSMYIREGAVDPAYIFFTRHEGGYTANPSLSLEGSAEFQKELDEMALSGAMEDVEMEDLSTGEPVDIEDPLSPED